MNSFIEYKVEDIFFLKNWHHLLFLIWKAEELRSFGIFQWKIASRLSWFCSWPLLDFFLRSVAFDRKKKKNSPCLQPEEMDRQRRHEQRKAAWCGGCCPRHGAAEKGAAHRPCLPLWGLWFWALQGWLPGREAVPRAPASDWLWLLFPESWYVHPREYSCLLTAKLLTYPYS